MDREEIIKEGIDDGHCLRCWSEEFLHSETYPVGIAQAALKKGE